MDNDDFDITIPEHAEWFKEQTDAQLDGDLVITVSTDDVGLFKELSSMHFEGVQTHEGLERAVSIDDVQKVVYFVFGSVTLAACAARSLARAINDVLDLVEKYRKNSAKHTEVSIQAREDNAEVKELVDPYRGSSAIKVVRKPKKKDRPNKKH